MFGGKREKALEQELEAVKQENERRRALMQEISAQKGAWEEQFTRMTAAQVQLETDVAQVREHLQQTCEMTQNGAQAAGDIHNAMIQLNNGVESFGANHSVFVEQVRAQNDKIIEIVENNKHFTTPMKYILETPAVLKGDAQSLKERAERMKEFSKNMSVLSLNAAIEAGRMGESGGKFIAAAEEVRVLSENYEKEARALEEQLIKSAERMNELEEQIHHLNELLKENNISMGKLYKDCMQNTAVYNANQIDLRELLSKSIIGRTDALRQSEQESAKAQEGMLLNLGDIEKELREYKSSADDLEEICKKQQLSAEEGCRGE